MRAIDLMHDPLLLMEKTQMNDAARAHLSPEVVLNQLKQHGVTHVVWLPDSETNWLYLLMKADPTLTLVAVPREGLACSVAAGLAVGGAVPVSAAGAVGSATAVPAQIAEAPAGLLPWTGPARSIGFLDAIGRQRRWT